MCAEWHADGLGYFLWQLLLVVLWLCTTSLNIGQPKPYIANPQPCTTSPNIGQPKPYIANSQPCTTSPNVGQPEPCIANPQPCTTSPIIGQPTLYIANPEPCVIVSDMNMPLHYFPNIGQCLTLALALLPHEFDSAAQTEICCGGSACLHHPTWLKLSPLPGSRFSCCCLMMSSCLNLGHLTCCHAE